MGQQTVVHVPAGYALTLTAVSAGTYFIPGNPGDVPGASVALAAGATVVLGPFNTPRSYSLQSNNLDMTYSLALSGIYSAADEAISDQAAMDLKANLAGPTFTGTVVLPATTSIGDVSATELAYVNNVTSAIQTQINTKAPTASPTFTGTVALPSTTSIGNVSDIEIGYLDGVGSAIQTQLTNNLATTNSKQAAISGASLTAVTVAGTDKIIIQDTSDADNIKTVTAQAIADLAGGGSETPTASTGAKWDANVNLSANNFINGYATTATAAGTTTLTAASAKTQFFTGATTQTVVMPVASTLTTGYTVRIFNKSTGALTIQSSGLNAISPTVKSGQYIDLTCILASGTTAASWSYYIASAGIFTSFATDVTVNDVTVGLGGGSISSSTVVGAGAMAATVSGAYNSAFGNLALANVTSGTTNTAVGYNCLNQVSSGGYNTGVGRCMPNVTGSNNTAVGWNAIGGGSSCATNSAFGYSCLSGITTSAATANAAFGDGAGVTGATGGVSLTTGNHNTLVGSRATADTADSVGTLAIGADAVATKSTGATSGNNGPGIAIGSAAYPVGFRGDASIFPTAGAISGYALVKWNGTQYKVALYALA